MAIAGVLCILLFNILTAGKEVLAGNLVQTINPFLLVFVTFLCIAAFFHLCMALRLTRPVRLGDTGTDLLIINISSAASWMLFFYALKYVEPAIVTALITATGPLITLLMDHLVRSNKVVKKTDIFCGAGILLTTLYLLEIARSGQSAFSVTDIRAFWLAIAGSLLTGVAVAATTVFSKRLYDKGWKPGHLMAHRFYLLIFLSWLFIYDLDGIKPQLTERLGLISIIVVFGALIPIYILQLGIRSCRPVVVACIIASGPVFTIFIELLDDRLNWSYASLWGILILVVFVSLNVWFNRDSAND